MNLHIAVLTSTTTTTTNTSCLQFNKHTLSVVQELGLETYVVKALEELDVYLTQSSLLRVGRRGCALLSRYCEMSRLRSISTAFLSRSHFLMINAASLGLAESQGELRTVSILVLTT